MNKTTSFIKLFVHQDKVNPKHKFPSGIFTGANGEDLVAFGFPGLDKIVLTTRISKRSGKPYVCTQRPVRIEYNATGETADILSITEAPVDTQSLTLIEGVLGAADKTPAVASAAEAFGDIG